MSDNEKRTRRADVMISSTSLDLPEHRALVMDAILRAGMHPLTMDLGTAVPDSDAIKFSIDMTNKAEVYIGIFAYRYGYIPVNAILNPDKKSVTELEYRRAMERGIPVLIYIMSNKHPILPDRFESNSTKRKNLNKLKDELSSKHIVGFFDSVEDLHSKVLQSLYELKTKSNMDTEPATSPKNVTGPVQVPFIPVLPPKTYRRLIGRKIQIERITANLTHSDRAPMICIQGSGGMGKTTLAREAVDRCMNQFKYVAWASGQTEIFTGGKIHSKQADINDFNSLLDILGNQLQIPGVLKQGLDEKKFTLRSHLQEKPTLIVLDNMETVASTNSLVEELFQILGFGKVLITTRFPIPHDQITTIELEEMEPDDGLEFIQVYSEESNAQSVVDGGKPLFSEIYNTTGGQPLAIKLVVGMLKQRPKNVVFDMLKNIQPDVKEFYDYLYGKSWDLLSQNAQKLLVKMTVVPPGITLEYKALQKISRLDASSFDDALFQLLQLSLSDKSGSAEQPSYTLHPLIHSFVLSKKTKETAL